MNPKLICFSATVTAIVGMGMGVAVAEIAAPKFVSQAYQNLHVKYALVGAAAGLLIGGSQESVRQLKKQRDQEEAERAYQASWVDRN